MRPPRRDGFVSASHVAAVIGFVVCAVALLYPAQQTSKPVFQSQVTAVEIDVVATRTSGEIVRGLRADDFEVLEDGAPVAITSFLAVQLPDPPAKPAAILANRSGSAFGANDQPDDGRVVLIVLDDVQFGLTSGRIATARSIARRAIEQLQPGDIAGVMTTSGGGGSQAEFTSDKSRLLEAVERFVPLSEYQPPEIANAAPGGEGATTRLQRLTERRTGAAMAGLTAAARALGTIRHRRKSVLLVSQGFPATITEIMSHPGLSAAWVAIRNFFMTAQRHNVAIYAFDPCGLDSDTGCSRESRDNLRTMSELTGGFATINTNAPEAAVGRMIAESGSYYLIGYNSPAPRNDGSYHKITVRTRVPGVEIRARAGYESPRKAAPAAPVLPPVDALTRAVTQTRGLTMRAIAIPVPLPADPGAAVVIGLELASAAAARAGRIEFAALAIDQVGRPRGRVRFTTDFTGRTGSGWTRTGSRLDLPPGRYDIRIAAAGSDQAGGSVFTEVTIPDFRAELAVGGLSIGAESGLAITAVDRARGALPLIPYAASELTRGTAAAAQLPIAVAAKAASRPLTIVATLTGPDGTAHRLDRTATKGQDYARRGGQVHTVRLPSTLGAGRHMLVVECTLGSTTIVRELALTVLP